MTVLIAPWVVATLSALEGWDDEILRVVNRSYRALGESSELDADILATAGYGDLAQRLCDYDEQCREFWRGDSHGAFVTVQRTLATAVQIDRRDERADLVEEISFLRGIPVLAEYLDELLSGEPEPALLGTWGTPLRATLTRKGTCGTATVRVDDPVLYPVSLGGLRSFGEVARLFVLGVNWAKWRDRDARRLVSVQSVAHEIWPMPKCACVAETSVEF
jgi:hypothetical protein